MPIDLPPTSIVVRSMKKKVNFEYSVIIILLVCSFRSLLSQKVFEYESEKPYDQILEDLKYYKERSDYWRKEAGTLSCKVNGLGPNGGFCLDPVQKKSVGSNHAFDKGIAEEMSTLFLGSMSSNVSVVDFGCGFGQYGKYFKTTSSNRIEWVGYDGSENIESVTSGFVKFIDLTEPKFLGTNYDWAISIEVAEHLPMHLESNFLYMLHVHNKMGIFLTWAIPGQGGHHHVNEQPTEYWINHLRKYNYEVLAEDTSRVRKLAEKNGAIYLAKTGLVLARSFKK